MTLLYRRYSRLQEAVLGVGLLLIGLTFVAPSAAFDDSATSQASAQIASEFGWGFTMIALGVVQAAAAGFAGHRVRSAAAAASAIFWALALGINLVTAPTSAGVPFTLTFGLLSFAAAAVNFVAARLAGDRL